MADRSDPSDNLHRPMKINRKVRTVNKPKIQRLQKDVTFKGINPVNMFELENRTLDP